MSFIIGNIYLLQREQMSVQSVCGERYDCFCLGISDKSSRLILYPYQKLSWIEHEFVAFITYYSFHFDLMAFCRFILGTILYTKVVLAM